MKQDSLPLSYKSFLMKHGGKDSVILQGVKEIASSMPFTNLEGIEKYYKSKGVNIELDPKMKVPCSVCVPKFCHNPCGNDKKMYLVTFGILLLTLCMSTTSD